MISLSKAAWLRNEYSITQPTHGKRLKHFAKLMSWIHRLTGFSDLLNRICIMKNKEEIERGSEVLIDGIAWAIVEEIDPDTGYYFCIDRIGGEHDVQLERLDPIR